MSEPTLRVLLATDGSDDARRAVEWLRMLRLPPPATVRVVSVVSLPQSAIDIPTVRDYHRGLVDGARLAAEQAASAIEARGPVESAALEGDPRLRIVEEAERWDADLVVVGAKGLGAVKRFLLGSVSTAVVHGAHCPVAVIRGTVRAPARVLVPYDGSPDALAAVRFVGALPFGPDTEVHLIAAVPPFTAVPMGPEIGMPAWPAGVLDEETRRLRQALADAEAQIGRTAAERAVIVGPPAQAILTAAERADLVVVGARGLGPVGRLVLGSVSERVLQHAPCPVIVVKRKPGAA